MEEKPKMGRNFDDPYLISNRRGPGGRTYHCNAGSNNKNRKITLGGTVDYIAREGKFSNKRDELEYMLGEPQDMHNALQKMEDLTRRKNGKTAHTLVVELPRKLHKENRAIVADKIHTWYEKHGCPTLTAIHDELGNPHLHLIATARPFHDDQPIPEGNRWQPAKRKILDGPAAIHHLRKKVIPDIINAELRACGFEGDWNGGKLEDVGIDRPAKVRLPQPEYYRRTRGKNSLARSINDLIDTNPDLVRRQRENWVAQKRDDALRKKKQKEKEKRDANAAMMKKKGFVYELVAENDKEVAEIIIRFDERKKARAAIQEAKSRIKVLEKQSAPAPLPPLSKNEISFLLDMYSKLDLELPNLDTVAQRSEAFGVARGALALQKKINKPAPPTIETQTAPPAVDPTDPFATEKSALKAMSAESHRQIPAIKLDNKASNKERIDLQKALKKLPTPTLRLVITKTQIIANNEVEGSLSRHAYENGAALGLNILNARSRPQRKDSGNKM